MTRRNQAGDIGGTQYREKPVHPILFIFPAPPAGAGKVSFAYKFVAAPTPSIEFLRALTASDGERGTRQTVLMFNGVAIIELLSQQAKKVVVELVLCSVLS